MASRWLQQKKQKMKRMRRAYLKHYPAQGISPTKIMAYQIFQNRSRVRSNMGRQDQMSPIQDNSFMQPLPVQDGHYRPEPTIKPNTFISDFRVFTLMECDWAMRVREFSRGRLLGNYKGKYTSLYFDGAQHCIVEQGSGYIAISAIYGSADEAEHAWLHDRVCWVRVHKFDPGMQTSK